MPDNGRYIQLFDRQFAFESDKKALDECDLIVAVLDGNHVGAGTAWELGYGYAKGVKCIGICREGGEERNIEKLSAMLIESIEILSSIEELKKKLSGMKE